MAIKFETNYSTYDNSIQVSATFSEYEAMVNRDIPIAVFQGIVDNLVTKFIEVHGAEIVNFVDAEMLAPAILKSVGEQLAKDFIEGSKKQ